MMNKQNNPQPINNSQFKDTAKLENQIHFVFKNKALLTQALIHRSYLNEHRNFPVGHNERLEFLGDAVLELVVTQYLYNNFENPEGELTNWRASLVNSQMLGCVMRELDIESLLYLSRGESQDKSIKARDQILANVFEALTGAIYLEFGYDGAKKFIHDQLIWRLEYILKNKLYVDPKTLFQEKAQEVIGVTPHYKVLKETGPDHNKKFIVGLYINQDKISEGTGSSKQEAQVQAARAGLKIKQWHQ